jgi:predicted DNA-binding transcriptional regulator AlpA
MPVNLDGTTFYSVSEVADQLGISRQTLWRWRSDGKVPLGRKFQDRKVVFTEQEVERIREHAFRMEPIDRSGRDQLGLFSRIAQGGQP